MKKLLLIIAVPLFFTGLYFYTNTSTIPNYPQPKDGTIIRTGQSEDEDNANRREQYFELMHRAAPDTDWRSIDQQNRMQQYERKLSLRQAKNQSSIENFANGEVTGEWFERGSLNQAGSVIAVDYDVDTDQIYTISAGGTLWRGGRTGNTWTALNDDLQFNSRILKLVTNATGGKRIIAAIGKVLHYSDDEGLSWQAGAGLNFYDGWGSPRSVYVMNDASNTIYYLVQTWDAAPWAGRMWLFRSTDNGATYTQIHNFQHGDADRISMWSPYNSNELYILDKSATLYQVSGTTVSVLNTNTNVPAGGANNMLRGHKGTNTLTLYALIGNNQLYRSTDYGASWSLRGNLPSNAWRVGIEVSLDDPNALYYGEVNTYRSSNGGTSWTLVNQWWEYYDNVPGKLHADIMELACFYDNQGEEFAIISNHGGMSTSYDNLITTNNIGLQNLNVSQYYDLVTSPTDPSYMYAGTQDQGFQRSGQADGTGIENWEQEISGDYGQMIFSNSGQGLWIQYPGGSMSYYANPKTGGAVAWWDMSGSQFPSYGWMLPSAPTADYTDNSMLIGGGNLNGGNGNYLITLTYNGSNISASQFNYDFKANANSGGSISAVASSKIDVNRLYVATDDGTFFYSNDAGSNWSKTNSFSGPGNWYLYGATVLASDITPDVVYYGGSGYSNPAVYKSTNGGQSFTAMSTGLPNTLVHELAANADESLLFAATEVGPYVYVVSQNEWFDLRGTSAPMQRYISVEYIDSEDVVRFGTFGRGAWDFNINSCAAVLNVNDIVPTATFQAGSKIISDGQVPNGNNATYKAGDCVELETGFEVQPGGVFTGEIGDCN